MAFIKYMAMNMARNADDTHRINVAAYCPVTVQIAFLSSADKAARKAPRLIAIAPRISNAVGISFSIKNASRKLATGSNARLIAAAGAPRIMVERPREKMVKAPINTP